MFKTILVPVSLTAETEQTERALAAAVGLAHQHGALMHVMTVMPGYGSPWVAGYFPEPDVGGLLDTVYQQLRELIEPRIPDDIQVKLRAVDGTPYKEILKEAERVAADLIVLPSHSSTSVERLFLGSVAARVVERSPTSVMVIRAASHSG